MAFDTLKKMLNPEDDDAEEYEGNQESVKINFG